MCVSLCVYIYIYTHIYIFMLHQVFITINLSYFSGKGHCVSNLKSMKHMPELPAYILLQWCPQPLVNSYTNSTWKKSFYFNMGFFFFFFFTCHL